MAAVVDSSPDSAEQKRRLSGAGARLTGLAVLLGVLAVVVFFSITMGSRSITFSTIVEAFTDRDPTSPAQTVVRDLRVPRTLLGILAGAALGMAGSLLQGVTRNPLADPGIMGINAGAAAAMVTTITVLGTQSMSVYIWFAFLGAGAAVFAVYGIASFGREGATPVKLALAGAAITAGLTSLTTGIVMTDVDALNELRFWQVGSLAGRYWPVLQQVVVFLVIGIVLAMLLGRSLNGLALGEDVARALGQDVTRTRVMVFLVVTLLCGAATAACGPIVFLGLMVPHLARMLVGPDYRWILPYSLLLTPIILLVCDIVGRVATSPSELQVGVVIGVLGAPAFVALVRYRSITEL